MLHHVILIKSDDPDGTITDPQTAAAERYAKDWAHGTRNLKLERQYKELTGLFHDIRTDRDLALTYAGSLEKSKPMYTGPKGGKYSNPELTIPWREGDPRKKVAPEMPTQQRMPGQPDITAPRMGTQPQLTVPRGPAMVQPPRTQRVAQVQPPGQQQLLIPQEGAQQQMFQPPQPVTKRNWVDHKPGFPKQTIDRWKNSDGTYKQEREGLHKRIVDTFFEKARPPRPAGEKVAIVTMGGPASGKTTMLKRLLGGEFDNYVPVDPDAIKEQMPEYQEALNFDSGGGAMVTAWDAAQMCHEESSDISKEVLKNAIEKGMNISWDGLGADAKKHIERVKILKDAGYKVTVVMPDLDVDEALARAQERAERTGRIVPMGPPPPGSPDFVRPAYKKIPGNFEKVAREADAFTLYNSRKHPPDAVWSGGKGQKDQILDPDFVKDFKMRAEGSAMVGEGKIATHEGKEIGDFSQTSLEAMPDGAQIHPADSDNAGEYYFSKEQGQWHHYIDGEKHPMHPSAVEAMVKQGKHHYLQKSEPVLIVPKDKTGEEEPEVEASAPPEGEESQELQGKESGEKYAKFLSMEDMNANVKNSADVKEDWEDLPPKYDRNVGVIDVGQFTDVDFKGFDPTKPQLRYDGESDEEAEEDPGMGKDQAEEEEENEEEEEEE